MSERKVLQKYYPPDFDPSAIQRRRGTKSAGPRIQTVRLMAPFSMKCTTCGEFIYKGRKFNSRKESNLEDKYLGIQVFAFYIRCTRCSAEIKFKTDPKNNDYAIVSGAIRNHEPWRNRATEDETTEQRLDRLEREEAEAAGEEEKNAMEELEAKNADAQREMAAADALDEIRHRNARINRSEKEGIDFADTIIRTEDEERERQEREDDEAARKAFAAARAQMDTIIEEGSPEQASDLPATSIAGPSTAVNVPVAPSPEPQAQAQAQAPTFKRVVKKKKDHSALLGIKKKPSLV
ncbi:hypothetical protein F66182_6109 [Fusarium sp. NRRL 66182]|nr:hypothetical protein F66182_6109 [Fusarium sp. NRRL 66182]